MVEEHSPNPTVPVVDDVPRGSYGGYAAVAKELNILEPRRIRPFSRQLVQRWFDKRETNKFPEAHQVRIEGGAIKKLFFLDDVRAWHVWYRRTHPVEQKPMETIPLFDVDESTGQPKD